MFLSGIYKANLKATLKEIFLNLSRKDQDEMLQCLYDQGYSAKEIAKSFGISPKKIYSK